jgi:4'-phosphopantetheinyl transferase
VSDGAVVRVLTGRGSRTADREALVAFVAEVTHTDPALVCVVRRCPHCGAADHGRPAAVVDGQHRDVSLSRTTGVLALALGPTTSGTIGVDVERASRVSAAPLDVFTPGEQDRAARSGSVAVHRTACWAVKEAVLKRDGRALRVDPLEVDAVLVQIARDSAGDDSAGHDSSGHDSAGHDSAGHDSAGHDTAGHAARFEGVVQPVMVLRLDEDLVLAVAAGGAPVTVQDRRAGSDAEPVVVAQVSPGTRAAPAPRARRSTAR